MSKAETIDVTTDLFGSHPYYQRDGFLSFLSVAGGVRFVAWLEGAGLQVSKVRALCEDAGLLCINDRRIVKNGYLKAAHGVKDQLWVIREDKIDNLEEVLGFLKKGKIHHQLVCVGLLSYPMCCYQAFDGSSRKGKKWVEDPESRVFQYAVHVPSVPNRPH